MIVKSKEELEGLKRIGDIVGLVRDELIKMARPGITTLELDQSGEKILKDHGARSAPEKDYGFPGAICICVEHEAAHGIPSERVLQEGDLINIDVSAEVDGYYGDTGASVVVGQGDEKLAKLCQCAEDALYKGLEKAKSGTKLNQIGRAIHKEALNNGFTVIRNLTGHGIGTHLHEEPDSISNYKASFENQIIKDGQVLAVETFISTGAEYVEEMDDGWTMATTDGSYVAQYEHTVVVTKGEPIILTKSRI